MAEKFFQYEIANLGESKLGNVDFRSSPSAEADAGQVIEFMPVHIKNAPVIKFMAFITNFQESFNQTFTDKQPYGRLDPYYIWRSSSRSITLALDILSSSRDMALRNLNNLNWFLASQYPAYGDTENATSIAATPIFRVKYANMISSVRDRKGLLAIIENVSVNPDLKAGYIKVDLAGADKDVRDEAGFPKQADQILVPKNIGLSCNLNIVHESSLGWDVNTGRWRGKKNDGFPYGFGVIKDSLSTAGARGEEPATNVAGASAGSSPEARDVANKQKNIGKA